MVIQQKCAKCHKVNQIQSEKVSQYQGKTVNIKCSNPQCQALNPLVVPFFSSPNFAPDKTIPIDKEKTTLIDTNFKTTSVKNVKLCIVENDCTKAQEFNLAQGINKIGRKSNVPKNVAIDTTDTTISREHCEICFSIGKQGEAILVLNDCNSKNGTYLQGAKTKLAQCDKVYVSHGQTIRIGKATIKIIVE